MVTGNEVPPRQRRDSLDDVRYRTRMSVAEDLSTMARVGGDVLQYTGQGIGRGKHGS